MSGARERCTDCGYWISAHVTAGGRFLGCPIGPSSKRGGEDESLPRIAVRVGRRGTFKGRVLVTWPDYLDGESGQIVVWDLGTGDRTVDDRNLVTESTRRADRDLEQSTKEEIEYQIGGRVRVVGGNWPTRN